MAAVGPDGSLYLATNSSVLRGGADGTLTRIAGAATVRTQDITHPQPPLDGLPAPATEVDLPQLDGLAVDPDSAVFLITQARILRLRDGVLSEVASTTSLAGIAPRTPDGHTTGLGGLAIDTDGSLFTTTFGDETSALLHISGLVTAARLADDIRFINEGVVVGAGSGFELLVTRDDGFVCARA